MLVTFPEALTVTEHYDLGRYGELSLSADGRLFNTTNDQGATALENSLRRLLLDDGSIVENPALVPITWLQITPCVWVIPSAA